jgi:Spx/MgsR family transcriptional regulator
MLTLHGLKNCDSCRQARKWLDANGVIYQFHDLRADGLDRSTLERWTAAVGWEALLNRRSMTWRGLGDAAKEKLDEATAIDLMLKHPALVKRPVTQTESRVLVGFSPADFEALHAR